MRARNVPFSSVRHPVLVQRPSPSEISCFIPPPHLPMMSGMSDTLRYIQVGVGTQGALWCRSVLPRLAQLGKAVCVGAVDANSERLKFPQEYLGLRPDQCFSSLIEALDSQAAHFVINSTPTV